MLTGYCYDETDKEKSQRNSAAPQHYFSEPLAINSENQYDCGEYPYHRAIRYTKPLALSTIATEI